MSNKEQRMDFAASLLRDAATSASIGSVDKALKQIDAALRLLKAGRKGDE